MFKCPEHGDISEAPCRCHPGIKEMPDALLSIRLSGDEYGMAQFLAQSQSVPVKTATMIRHLIRTAYDAHMRTK